MSIRFLPVLVALVLLSPLRGQDEPVHMRPEFPLIFPLEQTDKIVTVKYPIMINPTTVLKPGMQLRVLYTFSRDVQNGESDHAFAHKGTQSDAYARDPSAALKTPTDMPPEMAREVDGYRKTVWQVTGNFVMAMAQYPTDGMHLIYSPTVKNNDLHDERFSFFDGLLVGQPNGKVAVIAVEKESKSAEAGIKAGDEILSVGGVSIENDLNAFAAAYSHAKKVAVENEVSSYPMVVRSPNSADSRTADIPMPPRIKSGLMDGFH